MEIIHTGALDLSSTKSNSKNWLKKTVTKPWKKRHFILCREEDNTDKISLLAYEKEDHFKKQKAKKVLDLFPRFKVAKKQNVKGKEFVFQVSNDEETWFLAAENQRILDLWVIQIQMQTKLSKVISGRIFSVKAASTRPLQRIGAKDQTCLLHFTKWGLTLALQESRSVLSLWPLGTIRNYESTGTGQFVLEAGRRAPMGEGKYAFFTFASEDEVMFNVIDVFVTARLDLKANLAPSKRNEDVTDDDILAAYDKHHSCVLGAPPPDVFSDDESYSKLGRQGATRPLAMSSESPPSYDHLTKTGEIRPVLDPVDNFPAGSYDQLDRTSSWGTASLYSEAGYNTIDRSKGASDAYDHLGRISANQGAAFVQEKGHYNRFGSLSDDKACISPGNYPLTHHEPSVPNILDNSNDRFSNDQRFGSFSSTNSEVTYSNTPSDQHFFRQVSSGGLKQRKTARDKELPLITDDPPPLPPRSKSGSRTSLSLARPVPRPGDAPAAACVDEQPNVESVYQNSEDKKEDDKKVTDVKVEGTLSENVGNDSK